MLSTIVNVLYEKYMYMKNVVIDYYYPPHVYKDDNEFVLLGDDGSDDDFPDIQKMKIVTLVQEEEVQKPTSLQQSSAHSQLATSKLTKDLQEAMFYSMISTGSGK